MFNTKSKCILLCLLILLTMNSFLFSDTEADPVIIDDSSDQNDPSDSEMLEEMIEPPSPEQYTDLEFSNLTDEEKKDVYFNSPHLLPENFDPCIYMHIFYPGPENPEN